MYAYFVSFKESKTDVFGNCTGYFPTRITTIEQIHELEHVIAEKEKCDKVTIINYVFLHEDKREG